MWWGLQNKYIRGLSGWCTTTESCPISCKPLFEVAAAATLKRGFVKLKGKLWVLDVWHNLCKYNGWGEHPEENVHISLTKRLEKLLGVSARLLTKGPVFVG